MKNLLTQFRWRKLVSILLERTLFYTVIIILGTWLCLHLINDWNTARDRLAGERLEKKIALQSTIKTSLEKLQHTNDALLAECSEHSGDKEWLEKQKSIRHDALFAVVRQTGGTSVLFGQRAFDNLQMVLFHEAKIDNVCTVSKAKHNATWKQDVTQLNNTLSDSIDRDYQ